MATMATVECGNGKMEIWLFEGICLDFISKGQVKVLISKGQVKVQVKHHIPLTKVITCSHKRIKGK